MSFDEVRQSYRLAARETWVQPPEFIFHYTSAAGLHGILESNSLWGGNYAFMNDTSEFAYAQAVLMEVVAEQAAAAVDNERLAAILKLVKESTHFQEFDLYLTCFCEDEDLLSQWRGYGGQDSRYCLRFKSTELPRADADVSPPMSVIYSPEEQRSILLRLLDIHLAAFRDLPAHSTDEELTLAARCITACALPMLVRLKNPVFKEEKEWRSVRIWKEAETPAVKFVNSGGFMKPFFTLLRGSGETKLPLSLVIAGASRADTQSLRSAKMMLRRYDYTGVNVIKSKVPLAP